MTRAIDELDLIVPQRLFMYQQNNDRHVYTKMSSPSYSAGLEFELTGVAQSVELA